MAHPLVLKTVLSMPARTSHSLFFFVALMRPPHSAALHSSFGAEKNAFPPHLDTLTDRCYGKHKAAVAAPLMPYKLS